MDWLNDKKNQPIVITVATILILGVLVMAYFMYMKPADDGSADVAMESEYQEEYAEETPAEEDVSATPAVATKKTSGELGPAEVAREDPFLPIGYKPPKAKVKITPRIDGFPFVALPNRYVPGKEKAEKAVKIPEPAQPVRRMAGLMINDRVFAIIETNGESQIVQPGDMLKDQLAVVEKIESDRVILKTTSKNPRYITVRMAAAPKAETDAFYNAAANATATGAAATGGVPPGMAGSFPGRAMPQNMKGSFPGRM